MAKSSQRKTFLTALLPFMIMMMVFLVCSLSAVPDHQINGYTRDHGNSRLYQKQMQDPRNPHRG